MSVNVKQWREALTDIIRIGLETCQSFPVGARVRIQQPDKGVVLVVVTPEVGLSEYFSIKITRMS